MLVVETSSLSLLAHTLLQWRQQQQFRSDFTFSSDQLGERQPESRRTRISAFPSDPPLRAPEKAPARRHRVRSANTKAPPGFFSPLLFFLLCIFAGFQQRERNRELNRERRRDGRAAEVDALSHGGRHGRAPRPAAAYAGRHRRNGRRRKKTGHWRHFTANYDHHGSKSGRSPSQVKICSEQPPLPLSGGGGGKLERELKQGGMKNGKNSAFKFVDLQSGAL